MRVPLGNPAVVCVERSHFHRSRARQGELCLHAVFPTHSHGSLLNASVYVAAGSTHHPTAIVLHGFPGNERNLDFVQSIRRTGWNVLYFDYRGSWGLSWRLLLHSLD